MNKMKPRKIVHKCAKQFGYSCDKWARGNKGNGYARSYGHYTTYHYRTRKELINDAERNHDELI